MWSCSIHTKTATGCKGNVAKQTKWFLIFLAIFFAIQPQTNYFDFAKFWYYQSDFLTSQPLLLHIADHKTIFLRSSTVQEFEIPSNLLQSIVELKFKSQIVLVSMERYPGTREDKVIHMLSNTIYITSILSCRTGNF